MPNINPILHYQQIMATSLEARSYAWQDIVSNAIPLFNLLDSKGLWQTYSGPRIRQTLLIDLPSIQWYAGYDLLDTSPTSIFNDAYYDPKMCAVPISLTRQELLGNMGEAQILDIMEEYIAAAEAGLVQGMEASFYGDGSGFNGKELDGLGVAIPEVPTNMYAGIDRTLHSIWATGAYDVASFAPDIGTAVDATTIRPFYMRVMSNHIRGRSYPDIIVASQEHFEAYDSATVSIQRIQRADSPGRPGFRSLEYVGAGVSSTIYYGGGRGSNMPENTSFFLNSDSFRMRYNSNRNFSRLFDGEGATPINQDAVVQFVGWMGNLTMTNSAFNARMFDSGS